MMINIEEDILIKNTYNRCNRFMPKKRRFGNISDKFFIKRKDNNIENNVYIVLRPDKDNVAKLLFSNKKVVYLRYDKYDDMLLIDKYNSLVKNDKN